MGWANEPLHPPCGLHYSVHALDPRHLVLSIWGECGGVHYKQMVRTRVGRTCRHGASVRGYTISKRLGPEWDRHHGMVSPGLTTHTQVRRTCRHGASVGGYTISKRLGLEWGRHTNVRRTCRHGLWSKLRSTAARRPPPTASRAITHRLSPTLATFGFRV